LLFATLREPPPSGSVRESLLLLFVLKREQIEHARWRALIQTVIDKEKGIESFDTYRKLIFPWSDDANERRQAEAKKLLVAEIARGGLAVRPLWQKERPVTSRLQYQTREVRQRIAKQKDELYAKLGKTAPLDASTNSALLSDLRQS